MAEADPLKSKQQDVVTLTVTDSQAVGRADGTAGILLKSKEAPPIAFAVDLHAIELLRKHLTECERLLRTPTGKA